MYAHTWCNYSRKPRRHVKGSEGALIPQMDDIIVVSLPIISRFNCDVTRGCDFYYGTRPQPAAFFLMKTEKGISIRFSYNVNRFKRKPRVEHFVALSGYNVLSSHQWNLILYCYPGAGSFWNRESLLSFAGFNRDFGSGDRRVSTEHRDIFQTRQTGERAPFDWLEWRTCRNFWVYCVRDLVSCQFRVSTTVANVTSSPR